jgi:hypothetical protein
MWKLRIGVLVISGALGLGSSSAAWAAGGGDSNRGDVWLDNAGQPAGPGHEMDPHLACSDIVLYGAGLAERSGSFAIDGWPPSGSQSVDYLGQWQVQSGTEQIALVPIRQLLMGAQASGDSATPQGAHFKLDFSQDPQKHKTFWIDCPPSTPGGGGSTSGGGGGTIPGGSGAPGGGTNTSPGAVNTPAMTSSGGPVKTSIGAVTTSRPRHPARKRHRKLVHPARHRAVHRRHVRRVSVAAPPFTG